MSVRKMNREKIMLHIFVYIVLKFEVKWIKDERVDEKEREKEQE